MIQERKRRASRCSRINYNEGFLAVDPGRPQESQMAVRSAIWRLCDHSKLESSPHFQHYSDQRDTWEVLKFHRDVRFQDIILL